MQGSYELHLRFGNQRHQLPAASVPGGVCGVYLAKTGVVYIQFNASIQIFKGLLLPLSKVRRVAQLKRGQIASSPPLAATLDIWYLLFINAFGLSDASDQWVVNWFRWHVAHLIPRHYLNQWGLIIDQTPLDCIQSKHNPYCFHSKDITEIGHYKTEAMMVLGEISTVIGYHQNYTLQRGHMSIKASHCTSSHTIFHLGMKLIWI